MTKLYRLKCLKALLLLHNTGQTEGGLAQGNIQATKEMRQQKWHERERSEEDESLILKSLC